MSNDTPKGSGQSSASAELPPSLPPDELLKRRERLEGSLEQSIEWFKQLLLPDTDFVIRHFDIYGRFPAALFYISSMTKQAAIHNDLLKPLMYMPDHLKDAEIRLDGLETFILRKTLYFSDIRTSEEYQTLTESIMRGYALLLVDGLNRGIMINTRDIDKRAVEQPPTEQVIQGPREGFIESMSTNLALMRYRLATPDFRTHIRQLGRLTKTPVAICYIEGVVDMALVDEVKTRLSKIDVDGILDSGFVEQYIEDSHLSPFPQIQNTEKPDKAVAQMLEGRVVIIVEGSPFGLIIPSVFSQFYQTTEDYATRFLQGSFVRIARVVALVFSLIFPSLYVAIISFNPELIPTEFAVAVAGGRAGVPFPSLVEVLIIEISMEVLREATIRLPQQVGGALSIVGVLVVGQAAVSAGFSSPITVVVIALTTIGSFATPAYNAAFALRMLRFPLIIISGMFGLYGLMIGLILIGNHLLSLKSFGVPYLTPAVPLDMQGLKDLLIRGPLWWMRRRPAFLHPRDSTRVARQSAEDMTSPGNDVLENNSPSGQGG
ncbi:spore germination protein [Paenibacillus sp. IB182496]|uniref:Spore germination protein n=1 Tax=Paenibacillus sabuli TaxID=2772509 RepID=A0A927BWR9_9BACL|nr:spore germination protein [Paenibacillus sabuli]MBD2846773.1 spore germination protein [Paenibacillus sabuli]